MISRLIISSFIVISGFAQDLSLSKAYELILLNENSLKANEYILKSKEEDIVQAKSKLYPQIEGKISITESKREINRTNSEELERNKNYSIYISQAIFHPEYYGSINKSKYAFEYEKLVLEEKKQRVTLEMLDIYLNILKLLQIWLMQFVLLFGVKNRES